MPMSRVTTVAIPTLDAGPSFQQTLEAIAAQEIEGSVQLLICDSGSTDQTVEWARAVGADVLEIPREAFSHGLTRNLLMEEARGSHVAFLTQDAVPASPRWLAELCAAFAGAANVGMSFGPYLPRPGASLSVVRELTEWFGSFSPDGAPRVDWLAASERAIPSRELLGHRGFFTDANGCIARDAWRRVPFRDVAYAEDHLLAHDMLRAGYAKVYTPHAAVIHSHEYSPWQWLERSFDESRAVTDIYDWTGNGQVRTALQNLRGGVSSDLRFLRARNAARGKDTQDGLGSLLAASLCHQAARTTGAFLGAHARRLPAAAVGWLSLEGRR